MMDKAFDKPCEVCGKIPWNSWGVAAPELVGDPVICTKCFYRSITGRKYKWKRS